MALKERKSTDEQSHWIPDADNHLSIDLAQDQQQFDEWLASAKSGNDVRNRIAVSGGTVSRGQFGKFYLLVAEGPVMLTTDRCDQGSRLAANDMVFDQQIVSNQ